MSIFEIGALLVGLSAFFGYFNHRFMRLPHTVGLLVMALALSLPVNEYKPTILTITYAVVLFSIIVQGLTIKPLIERLVAKGPIDAE